MLNSFKTIARRCSGTKQSLYENVKILGIETSCDDTGCGIVNNNGKILGDSVHSQNLTHLRYGGINPIVAQDLHRENIEDVVNLALGPMSMSDIDAVAVTVKPGLFASLQIGVKYANYLAKKYNKPVKTNHVDPLITLIVGVLRQGAGVWSEMSLGTLTLPIHHMEAHALVARMFYDIPFPFLVLLISGGHSILGLVRDVDDFVKFGGTLDDAPGEAFDKVARRMKLRNIPEYSQLAGGKAVELAALKSKNADIFSFPLPLARSRNCNFSFSGLKETLVKNLLKKEVQHNIRGDGVIPEVNDLCAAFQLAVAEHLVHRTHRAIEFCELKNLIPAGKKNLVISGGVACNDFIFKSFQCLGQMTGFNVIRPQPCMCTDNGVMIAWNGVERLQNGCELKKAINILDIEPKAPFGKVNLINQIEHAHIYTKVTRLKSLLYSD